MTSLVGQSPQPCPVFQYKDKKDVDYMTIDQPANALRFPYLPPKPGDSSLKHLDGSEDFLSYWADEIVAQDPRTDKSSMFTIIAPPGKGKTRTIRELAQRISTVHSARVFPLAIPLSFSYDHTFGTGILGFAFNIAAIILSMAYRHQMYAIRNALSALLRDLFREVQTDYAVMERSAFALPLLQGCVQYLVQQVRLMKPQVDTLVLFVDDLPKGRLYGIFKADDGETPLNLVDVLHEAMVSNPVLPDLKCKLVVTSNKLNDLMDRRATPIALPDELDVDKVFEQCIRPTLRELPRQVQKNLSAYEESLLKKLLLLVSSTPSNFELLNEALRVLFASRPKCKVLFDKSGVHYKQLLDLLMRLYARSNGIFNSLQRTVLFGEANECTNQDFHLAYNNAFFLNTPSEIDRDRNSFIPRTGLLPWFTYRWHKLNHAAMPANPLIETIWRLTCNPQLHPLTKTTYFAEIGCALITARLQALSDEAWPYNAVKDQENISFIKLLGLVSRGQTMNKEVVAVLHKQSFNMKGKPIYPTYPPIPDSESTAHVKALGEFSLVGRYGARSFRDCHLRRDDYADGIWLLRTMNGEGFALIVEFKQSNDSMSPTPIVQTDNTNYFQTSIVSMCKAQCTKATDKNSALAAIADGRYLYVVVQNDLEGDVCVNENVVVLGKESASEFFIGMEPAVRSLDKMVLSSVDNLKS